MKIAYLFRGHSRTWKQCYKNFFDNIFSAAPGDIYIHTWDSVSSVFGSNWNGFAPLNIQQKEIAEAKPNLTEIYDSYKPKLMIVEPDKIRSLNGTVDYIASRIGLKFMLQSSQKMLQQAMEYDNYDYIFETRMDINYKSKLDINEFNSTELMCSEVKSSYIMDFYFFGSVDNMKAKINYADNVQKYWYDKDFVNMWYEESLLQYLNDNNLKCKNSSLIFDVPRIF